MLALLHTNPPHPIQTQPIVSNALIEDMGRAGDITTDAIIAPDAKAFAVIAARQPGVVCGLIAAHMAFKLIDTEVTVRGRAPDGSRVEKGATICELDGPARAILTAERVALNFVGHLSGIATATRAIADTIAHTKCKVICTRKTTPGLRIFEKYAVRCGGGLNHRFGLDDAVLVKDNHIQTAGGVAQAVKALRGKIGPMVKIELEVDTLEQLREALTEGIDAILLDNMSPETMAEAVAITKGRAKLEASGGVTLERARAIAESGVDYMSSGALTHSVRNLDVGLDFL